MDAPHPKGRGSTRRRDAADRASPGPRPRPGQAGTRGPLRAERRTPRRRTLRELQPLVRGGHFRICSHAVRHAMSEGFTERDIVDAMLHGRELMRYWEDERILVLGYMPISAAVKIPLHVVMEFRQHGRVDVVTAYIPVSPHRVPSRARLAEALRYDRHVPSRSTPEGGRSS